MTCHSRGFSHKWQHIAILKFGLHLVIGLFWEVEVPHGELEGVDDGQVKDGDDEDSGDDEEEDAGEEAQHLEVDALEELLEGDLGVLDPPHPLLLRLLAAQVDKLKLFLVHGRLF